MAEPWLIHFFQRHVADDESQSVPAIDFLGQLPQKVQAELLAVLDAVAEAPPPAFSGGGGKWEAMHGEMSGFFEIRAQGGGMNHRLFCLLERNAADLGGSSIVVVSGLSKPKRSAVDPKDYRRALLMRSEFEHRRSVLGEGQPALRSRGTNSRPIASAIAVSVPIVGLGFSALNSRRTTSGARSARRASSALEMSRAVRCSSSALTSRSI